MDKIKNGFRPVFFLLLALFLLIGTAAVFAEVHADAAPDNPYVPEETISKPASEAKVPPEVKKATTPSKKSNIKYELMTTNTSNVNFMEGFYDTTYEFRSYGLLNPACWADIKHTARNYSDDRTELGLLVPLNYKKNFQLRLSHATDVDNLIPPKKRTMSSNGARLVYQEGGYGILLGIENNAFDYANRAVGLVSFGKKKNIKLMGGVGYQKFNTARNSAACLIYDAPPGNWRAAVGTINYVSASNKAGEDEKKAGTMAVLSLLATRDKRPNPTFYSYYLNTPNTQTVYGGLIAIGKPGAPVNPPNSFDFPGSGIINQIMYDELGKLKINPRDFAFSVTSLYPDGGNNWKENWTYGGVVLTGQKIKIHGVFEQTTMMGYYTMNKKCLPHIGIGTEQYKRGATTDIKGTVYEAGFYVGIVQLRAIQKTYSDNTPNSTLLEARCKF
ncbi:MAG: hypothetical protein JW728_02735 [Candidatus Aureabacteria bacterium]|nr:hypothetical protein [Candidatus Auribacterota bacterium]